MKSLPIWAKDKRCLQIGKMRYYIIDEIELCKLIERKNEGS
jgi:hypothetical protein